MSDLKMLACAALTACLCAGAVRADGPETEFYPLSGMEERNLPFSEAVRVGDLLFVSGTLGIDPATGRLVEGGIAAETRATMEQIKAIVERRGSSMDRVAKCTVFLADMAEWPAMNAVYVEFFPHNKPARSALGASGLALGARVEIECIAAVGSVR